MVIIISPSTKEYMVQSFFQIFFLPWWKSMKNKLPQGNLFKLDASRRGTTMMNILIIIFTQYFLGKFSDLVVRISPFNQRVHGSILFSNFLFFPWWKWMKEVTFGQLLQLFPRAPKCLGKKGLVVFYLEEKGIKLFSPWGGELPSLPRKNGLNWFGESFLSRNKSPNVWEENKRNKTSSYQTFYIPL